MSESVALALSIALPMSGTICYVVRHVCRMGIERDQRVLQYRQNMAQLKDAQERRLLGDGK
jgi:hypothetical protein